MVEVTLAILVAAFCLFFVAALRGEIHLGKLTIHPGWLAFSLWGLLAALNSATETGQEGHIHLNVALLFVLGLILAVSALTTIFMALRAKGVANEIHTLVNSMSTAQNARIDQLTDALQQAEVIVPPREDVT